MNAIDLQPTLVGATLSLRPLRAEDFEALYAAASDPLIWAQHPDPLRYQREIFKTRFFDSGLASGGAFVIVETATGQVLGSSRYYGWDAEKQEVAIGFTFLVRSHWGGATNRELKALMLAHAFRWAKRVWFHVGVDNLRSRKALDHIGALYSHEETKVLGGVSARTAFYRIDRAG